MNRAKIITAICAVVVLALSFFALEVVAIVRSEPYMAPVYVEEKKVWLVSPHLQEKMLINVTN